MAEQKSGMKPSSSNHSQNLFGIPYTLINPWRWEKQCVTPPTVGVSTTSEVEKEKKNLATRASLTLFPHNIFFTCHFRNAHHRCCWSRTFFDSTVSSIIQKCHGGRETREAQKVLASPSTTMEDLNVSVLGNVRRVCEDVSSSIKVFKKKPLYTRQISYCNALPPVLREPEEDINVYTLHGEVVLEIVVPHGDSTSELDGTTRGPSEHSHDLQDKKEGIENRSKEQVAAAALLAAPDFFFVTPSEESQAFLYAYPPSNWKDSKRRRHQLLLLQDVQPVFEETGATESVSSTATFSSVSTSRFHARYTPFSWLVTSSTRQQFSGQGDPSVAVIPRRVQRPTTSSKKRSREDTVLPQRQEQMPSLSYSWMSLEFTFQGVYLFTEKHSASSNEGNIYPHPYNDSTAAGSAVVEMLSSLHSYRPYRTRGSLFAMNLDLPAERNKITKKAAVEKQEEVNRRKTIDRRLHRLMDELDSEIFQLPREESYCAKSTMASVQENKSAQLSSSSECSKEVTKPNVTQEIDIFSNVVKFFGVLKTARPILVEKCVHPNVAHLISIFPNSFSFPLYLSTETPAATDDGGNSGEKRERGTYIDSERFSATALQSMSSLEDLSSLIAKEFPSCLKK